MLAISTRAISGELSYKLQAISQAGFTSVEFCESDLINFEGPITDISKMIGDYGLTLGGFQKFSNLEGVEGNDRIQAFSRLEKKLDLIESIGGDLLLLCSSVHPKSSCEREKIIADLIEAGERGHKRGIRFAYLALPWAKNTRTEAEALSLVTEANQANLGLALNSLFTLGDGSKPSELRNIPSDKIFYVQLTDAPLLKMDLGHLSRNFLLPGQGELNLSGFVSLLTRAGYRGQWTLSQVSDHLIYGNHTAIDGYRSLVNLLDEVKRSEAEVSFPIPDLPEKILPSGFEFIEFTTDTEGGEKLGEILASMGFRQERHHRSQKISQKISLWRQGAVNLMINTHPEGNAHEAFLKNGTCVSDLGIRVKDAAQTVKRASALGATVEDTVISENVTTEELVLPAIRGAGDHLVHFIDEKSNLHHMWEINFNRSLETKPPPPTGIRRIDHVAQTMEYDQMMSWLLYYLTTFDMVKSTIIDVADPSGIIRSQALSSPEGEVRLNLNSSASKNTLAANFLNEKQGSGVQHIAFLTDNIFETSDRLRELGFERLSLPENYYTDLQSVFNLDDELIAQLKNGNIFYDCDGQGEYFQIYSLPIFKGFFFEIVERRHKYEEYGARNAPFRLRAQMKYLEGVNNG